MGKQAAKAKSKNAKPAEPVMDVAVGQRLREIRHKANLSLEIVAGRSALSVGFLSQIERGLSSPSLRVLATLADVFGVGIAALFGATDGSGDAPQGVVTRAAERAELKLWRTGISKQLLHPSGGDDRLNLFLVHMAPGGHTGSELYTHGGAEAGLVLDGTMSLTVDDKTWTLKAGDSFRFDSRRPHRFGNPAKRAKAVVLWVNAIG
jgi:transcriptional regulator with XRE-family HTH domain